MRPVAIATFVSSLPLAGCMAEPAPDPALAAAGAQTVQCIPVDRIVTRTPLDAHTVRFELTGGEVYHNQLVDPCPTLANAGRLDVLSIELHGDRVCRDDTFRAFDPVEARAVGTAAFPECRFGPFVRVSTAR